jgi:hypothetical protein
MRGPRSPIALLAPLLLGSAVQAGTLRVVVPETGPCGFEELSSALRAHLPGAEPLPGPASGEGEVGLTLRRTGAEWSLELAAPGQPPLRRRLAAADCLALSEAAALIAERYLASIRWVGTPAAVSALPPPPPPPRWQASLALGGGVGLGLTGPAPMGQLELGVRWGGWTLELAGAYLGSGQVDLVGAARPAYAFEHTGAATLAVGRRLALGPGAVRLALAPGAELFWVGSSPASAGTPDPLPHRQLVTTALPFVGAQAGYELELTDRLTLGLRAQARLHLGSARFSVEGYAPALTTHLVDGELAVTLGSLFF